MLARCKKNSIRLKQNQQLQQITKKTFVKKLKRPECITEKLLEKKTTKKIIIIF